MSALPAKADDLFASWSKNQWKSLYLFSGVEDFLIQEALERYRAHWLSAPDASLNHDRMDGEDHTASEILSACQTVPFLSDHRVVEVRNVSKLPAKAQDELAVALPSLPETTHLVLIWGKEWRRDDAKKSLVDTVSRLGQVIIFWPLFPENAQRWLQQRAKKYNKSLETQAGAWLVQQAGEGLRLLDGELQKACTYVGNSPSISLTDVQAAFGYTRASSPYDWLTYIRQQKSAQALQILKRLLAEGEEPIYLLAILSGSMREWLSLREGQENPQAVAARFNLKRGEEYRFLEELKRFSEEDLTEGIAACVAAEQAIKTGKENPDMALTLLTLRLGRFESVNALR